MYCKKCGFQLSSDARFCPNCGTKVELNGIGNIAKNAVWGTIESDNDKSSHDISESTQWNQTAHAKTERESTVNNKSKKNSIQPKNDKTSCNWDIRLQSTTCHAETPPKLRIKIIKRRRIPNSNIFVAYWGYSNDNRKYPNQWYEDSNHNKISDTYYSVSSTIRNNIVIVKQNGKFAFAKICDNKFERVTKFTFDKYSVEEIRPEMTKYYVMYSAHKEAFCYVGNDLYKVIMKEIQDSRSTISFGTVIVIFFVSILISVLAVWLLGTLYSCIFGGLTWSESQNSNVSKEWIWVWLVLFIIIGMKGIKIFREPAIVGQYYIKVEKVNCEEFLNQTSNDT